MKYDPSFPALCDRYPPPQTPGYMVAYLMAQTDPDKDRRAVEYFEEFHKLRLLGTKRGFDPIRFMHVWGWPSEGKP